MVIDVPFEIWNRIASFLPPADLRRLYSINHAFFEIAMKEKYRVVLLNNSDKVVQALRLLTGSIISHHVRCLKLDLPSVISRQRGKRRQTIFCKTIRTRKETSQYRSPEEWIPNFFSRLSNLEDLELAARRYPDSDHHALETVMQLVTPTFISLKTLRVLKLDIMVEGYQSLSSRIVFPVLEHLSISLYHGYCSTDHNFILEDVLAPFVNNQHLTLRIFHLSTVHSLYTFDIPSFLLKLRHLPQLKTFGFWYPFVSIRQSDSVGLSHVLRLHSQHLLELALHAKGPVQFSMYPTREQWYGQEFLRVELPKLQVLDLDIELYDDIVQTVVYLGQFRYSLISLKLFVNILSYDDIVHVVETFSQQDRLKELYVSVDVLSPQLLTLLATNLPSLETLHLEFDRLSSSIVDGLLHESMSSNTY
ncbi:hypothetical protein H0H92_001671 [Tricholoma furcatifolium]|nr:hypothetical protein H0H92_001671 [Tricholoma furcatifolium]